MAAKILVRDDTRSHMAMAPAPEAGWYLMGGTGRVLAIIAGADLLLAWLPPRFASAEWKFATVSTTLNSLPLLITALLFMVGSAMARGLRPQLKTLSVVVGVLAVAIAIAGIIYWTTIPAAIASVKDPMALYGLHRSIARTAGEAVIYPLGLAWLAFRGWRHAATR